MIFALAFVVDFIWVALINWKQNHALTNCSSSSCCNILHLHSFFSMQYHRDCTLPCSLYMTLVLQLSVHKWEILCTCILLSLLYNVEDHTSYQRFPLCWIVYILLQCWGICCFVLFSICVYTLAVPGCSGLFDELPHNVVVLVSFLL